MSSESSTQLFGIELRRGTTDVAQRPPDVTIADHVDELENQGNFADSAAVEAVAAPIQSIVRVHGTKASDAKTFDDVFTMPQLAEVDERLSDFLGHTMGEHLEKPSKPANVQMFLGTLSTYFYTNDRQVTGDFGAFIRRHLDHDTPQGPRETNTRRYANLANEQILGSFETHYQPDFGVTLSGPQRVVEGSKLDWSPGIAECQFLILDYMRDRLAKGIRSTVQNEAGGMDMADIAHNLTTIAKQRRDIVSRATEVNEFLGGQVDSYIGRAVGYTQPTMHRGRPGTPLYEKDPAAARRALHKLENLLMQADRLAVASQDSIEDIPILEL